jgi:hypothetical protein
MVSSPSSMSSNSNLTTSPTPSLINARASYAASLIQSVAFGVYLVISIQAIQLQLLRLRRRGGGRTQKVLLAYSSVMLAAVLAWYALAVVSDGKTQIEHEKTACTPLGIMREALGTIMIWAADSLLVRYVQVMLLSW